MAFTEHASKKYVDERDALLATKNALANEAQERENVKALLDNHTKSGVVHVSDEERTRWNRAANALQGKDVRTNTSNGLREAVKVIAIALGAASVKALAACAAAAALASGAATVSTAPLGEIDFDASVVTNVTFEGLSTPDFVVYTNGYRAGGVPVVVTNTVRGLLAGYAAKMRVSPVEVPDGAAAKGVTFVDTYGEDQNQAVEMGEGASSAVSTNALLNAAPGTVARSVGVAIGAHSVVSNAANEVRSQGVAVGYHAQALASNAIAIGAGAQHPDEAATHLDVTEEVTKVGNATVARGETAIAVGYSAKATGAQSVAVGRAAEARASGSVQIGTGVNTVANSLAFRDWQLVEGDGQIPRERLVRAAEEISGGLFQQLERLVQPGNMTVVYGGGDDQVLEPRLGGVCEVELSKGTNDVYMAGAEAYVEPPLESRNFDLVVTNIPQAYRWETVDGERTLVPVPENENFGLDFSELPGGIAPTLMCEPSVGYVNGRFLTLTNAPVVVKVRQPATNRVVVVARPFRSQGGGAPEDDSAQAQTTAHAELLAMRAEGALMPGREYRITNYVATTTGDMESRSANRPFDIIVTADDERTLNEHARAVQREGDTYFANRNLAAWDVWYCIDNDTSRFAWALAEGETDPQTGTTGRGVVYRLVDERHNDCPYDFEGLQFVPYGGNPGDYRHTFGVSAKYNTIAEDTLNRRLNRIVAGNSENCHFGTSCSDITLNGITDKNFRCGSRCKRIITTGSYSVENIVFGDECADCTIGARTGDVSIGSGCENITIGEACADIRIGNYCNYVKTRSYADSVRLGDQCNYNEIRGDYISLGDKCEHNYISTGSKFVTLGSSCTGNIFGRKYFVFEHKSAYSEGDIVKDGLDFYVCSGSYIGDYTRNSVIAVGEYCYSNWAALGGAGYFRSTVDQKGRFAQDVSYSVGDVVYAAVRDGAPATGSYRCIAGHSGAWESSHFESVDVTEILSRVDFSEAFAASSAPADGYYRFITLEDGVSYVALHSTATGRSDTNYYQNVTVTKGVLGTSAEPKLIEDANVNQDFKTTYQPAASLVIGL